MLAWPKLEDGRIIDSFVALLRGRLQFELLECAGNTLALRVLSGQPRCGIQEAEVTCGDKSLRSKITIICVKDNRVYARWTQATPEELCLSDTVKVERRTNTRLPCHLTIISSNLPCSVWRAQNIGNKGLQILTNERIPKGHKVQLALAPGESETMAIKLEGEIRWCKRTSEGHLAGIVIGEDQQRRLDALRSLVLSP